MGKAELLFAEAARDAENLRLFLLVLLLLRWWWLLVLLLRLLLLRLILSRPVHSPRFLRFLL